MATPGHEGACTTEVPNVGFRNGPLFVKSSEWYLAAGFVLPYVVDQVAAT